MEKEDKTFESIKHIDEDGIEFWYARKEKVRYRLNLSSLFSKKIDNVFV